MSLGGLQGADREQARYLGSNMMQGAQGVSAMIEQINEKIAKVEWDGPFADQFKADWYGNFAPALNAAAEEMQRNARGLLTYSG